MSSLIPWVGGRVPAWDPFDDIWDIGFGAAGAGGRLWDAGSRGGRRDDTTTLAQTNVDWRETDNAHIFTAELPGVRKEEVKVEVEEGNNILKISGERTKEEENKSDTWHRVERRSGSFMRRFRIPENAIMDDVKCKLENGVLEVVVPKREPTPSARNVRSIEVA